jgi:mono/diheme cytochrome c family protein
MSRRSVVPPVAIVIAALLFAGCGGGDTGTNAGAELTEGGNPPTTTTPIPTTSTPAATTSTPTTSTGTSTTSTSTTPTSTASVQAGQKLFTSQGCSGCHTLQAAGANGSVGPNLDTALKGKADAFIRDSIVKPDAEIAKGYSAGIMPKDFGEKLDKQQLDQLVAFLKQSTSG